MSGFLYNLSPAKKISQHIELTYYNELPFLIIKHPLVRAAVGLQGAQLISWQPADQQPVIWLSRNAIFKSGVAIRGGVPICWPWFGKSASPSHGFARTMQWQLISHNDGLLNVSFSLELTANDQTRQLWPHDFTLLAHFKIGHSCEIELEAQGDFSSTAALHSYFHVQNIQDIELSGLGPIYSDNTDNGKTVSQNSEKVSITGMVDRIYTQPQASTLIEDQILERTIEVKHMYASDVVVWNPWRELSIAMEDMTDDGYQTMVCVETARINQKLIATPEQPAIMKVIFRLQD